MLAGSGAGLLQRQTALCLLGTTLASQLTFTPPPPPSRLPPPAAVQLYITLQNTIFLFLFACVAYGVGSCIVGQTARLPLVSDAADAQVR